MANTREIKERIGSIRDTQKITNAMYLISSNKLRRAKKALDATRPYFTTLETVIARMLRHLPDVESRYFERDDGRTRSQRRQGFLVITADKGLAGAYNHNVLKLAMEQLVNNENWELFVVGEYGRQYFNEHHLHIKGSFLYTAQNPTMGRARRISYDLLDRYERGELDEIYIIYTDSESSVSYDARMFRFLPLEKAHFSPDELETDYFSGNYEFTPSLEEVLDNLIPSYMTGYIYSALVDSFCAEQNARMMAMDAANRNAEKMLHELTIQFNRVRQAMITQEITEVAAGERAQKNRTK
jgi:F-type H+-transporting ATPase subunit gamma